MTFVTKCKSFDLRGFSDSGKVGECWATKEHSQCSCGGDPSKCDFYPEVREEYQLKIIANDIGLKHCLWCQGADGKTDLDFSIVDDRIGMYVPERLINFCPFCGRSVKRGASE